MEMDHCVGWSGAEEVGVSKCLLLLRRATSLLLRVGQLPSDCQGVGISRWEVWLPSWKQTLPLMWTHEDKRQISRSIWVIGWDEGVSHVSWRGPGSTSSNTTCAKRVLIRPAAAAAGGDADLELLPWGATCPPWSCWWPWLLWWLWGAQGPAWVHQGLQWCWQPWEWEEQGGGTTTWGSKEETKAPIEKVDEQEEVSLQVSTHIHPNWALDLFSCTHTQEIVLALLQTRKKPTKQMTFLWRCFNHFQ